MNTKETKNDQQPVVSLHDLLRNFNWRYALGYGVVVAMGGLMLTALVSGLLALIVSSWRMICQ